MESRMRSRTGRNVESLPEEKESHHTQQDDQQEPKKPQARPKNLNFVPLRHGKNNRVRRYKQCSPYLAKMDKLFNLLDGLRKYT